MPTLLYSCETMLYFNSLSFSFRKSTVNGGVKLFSDSAGLLSCEDAIDTFTEKHNKLSRKIQHRKQYIKKDAEEIDEAGELN